MKTHDQSKSRDLVMNGLQETTIGNIKTSQSYFLVQFLKARNKDKKVK